MATAREGCLVTFDRSIPRAAVKGAGPEALSSYLRRRTESANRRSRASRGRGRRRRFACFGVVRPRFAREAALRAVGLLARQPGIFRFTNCFISSRILPKIGVKWRLIGDVESFHHEHAPGGARPGSPSRGRASPPAASLQPPSCARCVRRGPTIPIGRGRATRYGLRQAWPTLDTSRLPLFRILETGAARSDGELFTLAARQTVWMPGGIVFGRASIELADARPSGFLGRHFAATHADLRLPARLIDWSDHHILLAMSRRGEDLPGNLIVGDESFARWHALDIPVRTRSDYPSLAEATTAGHPPGSSAGGERPKFGAFVDGRHVLVKFAARGSAGDVVARRWCDLLVLEALALDVASSRGVTTARTSVVDADSHCFLESERFDRVALRGRVAVSSLAAVQDDPADPWARAAVLSRRRASVS